MRMSAMFQCLLTAGVLNAQAGSFRFTATTDNRAERASFQHLLSEITAVAGDEGAFHVSAGDIDPPWDTHEDVTNAFGADTAWYPIVGNHEEETPADMVWIRDYYTNLPWIVNAGPAGCGTTTFSFDCSNAHCIVLNQYYNGTSDTGTDGDVVDALYEWLVADLLSNRCDTVFVFGHEPPFPANRHVGTSLDQYPENRDRFWHLLEVEDVVAYVCGHSHRYSRYRDEHGYVWQIDMGNAGHGGPIHSFLDTTVSDTEVRFDIWRGTNGASYALEYAWKTPNLHTLVAKGATWNYLDDGSDQGSTWHAVEFDDAAWSAGPAELGYGEGDERTVVSYGGNATNKHITTYFRHAFNVADPNAYSRLMLKLLRDDGAVVYVNDTEVYRSNLPDGPVSCTTPAMTWDTEGVFRFKELSPSVLQAGTNVIAVEVHQTSRTSSDVSFDLRLAAQYASDQTAPAAPTDLTATPMASSTMRLEWDDNSYNETGFALERSTNGSVFGDTRSLSADLTGFLDSGLLPAQTYYYRLKATHGTLGDSVYSAVASNATLPAGQRLVFFQDGVAPSVGYDGTLDAGISSNEPTVNYGAGNSIVIDGDPDKAGLILWDIRGIPAGSTVHAARLTFHMRHICGHTYYLYEMKKDWLESEATWNVYAAGNNWAVPGAQALSDRGDTVLGAFISIAGGPIEIPLNAAGVALVQQWVDNPASNRGIIICDYDIATSSMQLHPHEALTPRDRPELGVVFSPPVPQTNTVEVRIAATLDDVEEYEDGRINHGSSDLEFTYDSPTTGNQTVGIRFPNVGIPYGALIHSAYVQFTAEGISTGTMQALTIRAQAATDAPAFTTNNYDCSTRSLGDKAVSWTPPDWPTHLEAGPDQRTPDLSTLIQPLLDTAGWQSNNAVAFVVTGSGTVHRSAYTCNGSADDAPLLHVSYSGGLPDDSDGDGMSDTWENLYFGNLLEHGGNDEDSDGYLNLREFVAGTSPTGNQQQLVLDIQLTNNAVYPTFGTVPLGGPGYEYYLTRYYTLENAQNVTGTWSGVAGYTDLPGAGQTVVFSNQPAATKGFFRAKVRIE